MRHDNFCDRLISRMTCGSKRKEPSVSDGGKIERSGVPKAAKAFCLWPASLGYRANFCTTGSRRAHGPEGLNRFPFSHKGRRRSSSAQFPVSNEHVAPPPVFCLISTGSSVQLSIERLSNTDPAAPSDGMPAMTSVAKISLARRPAMVCLAPLKVSSQERAVMSTLLTRQTILSAVTEIFLA